MGFRTVCIESRCRCSYSGGYLVVTAEDRTTKVHLSEISMVIFSTTKVYLSAFLLSELAKAKIPTVFSDEKSFPVAQSLPLYGAHNCPARLASQLEWSVPTKKRVWQKVVRDKIGAQSEVLEELGFMAEANRLREYATETLSGDTTNREAAAASLYFSTLFGQDFNRDQNTDLNASLNYGYSILLSKVCREIVARGYETQMGIFHRGELNQWNLACDLMEPFRPYVDRLVVKSGFSSFNSDMKHYLLNMMNLTLRYDEGEYKVGSVVSAYIQDCFDALNRKVASEDIKIYVMRCGED